MKHIFIVLTSCMLLGCATPSDPTAADYREPEPRGSDCIFEGTVRDYRVLDDKNLVVTSTRKQKYHIRLSHAAFGLSSAWGIGFSSRAGQVCPGSDIVVSDGFDPNGFDPNGFDPEGVRIYSIRAIDETEYEHLLVRHGKKAPNRPETPPEGDIAGAEVEELD